MCVNVESDSVNWDQPSPRGNLSANDSGGAASGHGPHFVFRRLSTLSPNCRPTGSGVNVNASVQSLASDYELLTKLQSRRLHVASLSATDTVCMYACVPTR